MSIDQNRLLRAWLDDKRSELLTPTHAIVDVCAHVLDNLNSEVPEDFIEDMRRVDDAGKGLQLLINEILAPSDVHDDTVDPVEVSRRLRHDILNKLNAVMNYAAMWIDDVEPDDNSGLSRFLPDLELLRSAAQRFAVVVDDLVSAWNPDVTSSNTLPGEQLNAIRGIVGLSNSVRVVAAEQGRVLAVDDNPTNCDILRRYLELSGHDVTVAMDGSTAWDILRRQPFDVVLLDIMMPGIDGFDLLLRIKENPDLCRIPVIMISALNETDVAVRCIEAGADDYLSKPFNKVLLKARIDSCLRRRRLEHQLEQEKQRADELLHVILPEDIVAELKSSKTVRPRRFDNVAVLFADIVNFTPYCEEHAPEQVLNQLQQLVECWEESAVKFQVEKIKTIGDAFMAASGLPDPVANPVWNCVQCGYEMIDAAQNLGVGWNLRVGIHCGPVVAGVLGNRKYLYDLWGDTVNTASRMESTGIAGSITMSRVAWSSIAGMCTGTSIGECAVKGKGNVEMIRCDAFAQA